MPHRKPRLNPTLLEESSKTLKKTPLQVSPSEEYEAFREEAIRAFQEAAKRDNFLFGDYDGYESFRED